MEINSYERSALIKLLEKEIGSPKHDLGLMHNMYLSLFYYRLYPPAEEEYLKKDASSQSQNHQKGTA